MQNQFTQDTTRFWADDFDMDLPKILPGLRDKIGPIGDVRLWTLGGLSRDGLCSHPATWNGLGAIFWSAEPNLNRDEHGWVNINGCVTNDPLCTFTVWESIRDCWCHNYRLNLDGYEVLNATYKFYHSHFYPIMSNLRKWREQDVSSLLKDVEGWVIRGARNIETVITREAVA